MSKRKQWVTDQNKIEQLAMKSAEASLINNIRARGELVFNKHYESKILPSVPCREAEIAKRVKEKLKPIEYKEFLSVITQFAFQFDGRSDSELEDDMKVVEYGKNSNFLRILVFP